MSLVKTESVKYLALKKKSRLQLNTTNLKKEMNDEALQSCDIIAPTLERMEGDLNAVVNNYRDVVVNSKRRVGRIVKATKQAIEEQERDVLILKEELMDITRLREVQENLVEVNSSINNEIQQRNQEIAEIVQDINERIVDHVVGAEQSLTLGNIALAGVGGVMGLYLIYRGGRFLWETNLNPITTNNAPLPPAVNIQLTAHTITAGVILGAMGIVKKLIFKK